MLGQEEQTRTANALPFLARWSSRLALAGDCWGMWSSLRKVLWVEVRVEARKDDTVKTNVDTSFKDYLPGKDRTMKQVPWFPRVFLSAMRGLRLLLPLKNCFQVPKSLGVNTWKSTLPKEMFNGSWIANDQKQRGHLISNHASVVSRYMPG